MSEAINEVLDEEVSQDEEIAAEIAEEAGDQRFVIDDDGKANWAVQKIKEAQAEIENWKQYYSGALKKIERRQQGRISYLTYLLRKYFESVPHKVTKTQASYQLPSGNLVLKHPGPKYETDDAALLDWLKSNQMTDFIKVKTKEKPMWGELKKTVTISGENVVTEDGEIVPGVTVSQPEDTFDIK